MRTRALVPVILALALGGCVSFGGEAPDRLLTLTPTNQAPAGAATDGQATAALAVLEPGSPQRLAVNRVPVQVDPSTLAYLQDAFWVERPARLFQRLLAETIRSAGGRLVVDSSDLQYAAATKLSGQLIDMGYDVASSSVVVRFDATLQEEGGRVRSQRFENRVEGVSADAASVAPALNQAANQVAADVARWVNRG